MTSGLQQEVHARLRSEGGAALVAELAALLARTVPARLAQIGHGIAADDRAGVVRAAHGLRSSAGNFGAADLAAAAEALEAFADSPVRWQDAIAREATAAGVTAAWSDVADHVRRLAATHVESP